MFQNNKNSKNYKINPKKIQSLLEYAGTMLRNPLDGGNSGRTFSPCVVATGVASTRYRKKNQWTGGSGMTSSLLPFLASGDLQNKKNTNKLSGSFSFFQIYYLPFFLDLFHCRSDFFHLLLLCSR
jgi:hypothetical protein